MNRLASAAASFRYSLRHPWVRPGFAVLGGVALLCLAVALVWWMPAYREHARLRDAIDEHRRAVTAAERALELARAERESVRAIPTLEMKLRADANQAQLVQGVARIAAHRSVRVLAQSYEEGKASGEYVPLYLDLALAGNYATLRDFLVDLQGLPMWIEVLDARFVRTDRSAEPVRANVKLLTYRRAKTMSGGRDG